MAFVSSSVARWSDRIAPWVVVVALLFVVEAGVRHMAPRLDPGKCFVWGPYNDDAAPTFIGDPDLGWKLKPGLKLNHWIGIPITSTHDGFRADREFPRPKRGRRVLCLGDSATFGHGIPMPDQVYPGVLERLLRERLGTPDLDVVPMGIPGYTSHQGRLWLEREIEALDPDLITICFGFNDTSVGLSDRSTLSTSWPRRAARHVVYSSQALTHLIVATKPLLARPVVPDAGTLEEHPRVTAAEYLENIRAMVDMARSRGARALVVGQLYRNVQSHVTPQHNQRIADYRRALDRACAEWEVPFLEVPLLTEAKQDDNGAFFVDGEHPSPLGHRILAEAMLDLIVARGLLPDPSVAPAP